MLVYRLNKIGLELHLETVVLVYHALYRFGFGLLLYGDGRKDHSVIHREDGAIHEDISSLADGSEGPLGVDASMWLLK